MTLETSSAPTVNTPSPFRTATEVKTPETVTVLPVKPANVTVGSTEKADGVFIGYEVDYGVPYIAEYLGMKEAYKLDPTLYPETEEITTYLQDLVTTGQLDNSIVAIKAKLGQLEKMSGIDSTQRANMKLVRLAEYAKFENAINKAKNNSLRWSR